MWDSSPPLRPPSQTKKTPMPIPLRTALVGAGFAIDYVALADAETLVEQTGAEQPGAARPRRLLAAARMGTTRLIDNIAVD